MMEQLVPPGVVTVETDEELIETELFPEEQGSARRAAEKRRREFVTGRACAHLALRRLGIPPWGIPSGERGEPLWPEGVVGSITHCQGYRACAVARAGDLVSLGIDAEVHAPLPPGVLEEVASPAERTWATREGPGPFVDRLLFSAKEAVYKAWFPLTRRWLGFEDVELSVDERSGTFQACLLVEGPVVHGQRLTAFRGRWRVERDVVVTAVAVGAT